MEYNIGGKKYYTAKDFGVEGFKDEFTRVEYLQSTGTTDKQYIDTEYKLNKNTRFVADGMVVSGDTALFGARDGSNGKNKFLLQYIASNCYRVTYKSTEYVIDTDDILNMANVRFKFELDKTILKINNIVPKFKTVGLREIDSTGIEGKNNIFLFALNNSLDNTASNFGVVRIYSLKIYENDELIKEFIPVLDADGEPCFYEKVSKTFFYNKGQGKFDFKAMDKVQVINELNNISLSNTNITDEGYYETKLTTKQSRELPKELCIKIGNDRLKPDIDYIYNQETGDLSIYKNITENTTINEITSYTQVDYIISNRKQYINTGVKPKLNTKVVLTHYPRYRVPSEGGKYFGYRKNLQDTNAFFVNYGPSSDNSNGNISAYVGGTYFGKSRNTLNSPASEAINDIYREVITLSSSEFKTEIFNNYTSPISGLSLASTPVFDGTEKNMFLFGCNYGEKDTFYMEEAPITVRFKSMKIYEGDTLVRDFIPIKDSDNVYAIYDLVNNKYYYNQGMGDFTGPE